MKRLLKLSHRSERGFTLIELLIVIAILGIIAAIVIPNVAGFMTSGTLNAANTELENVRTAGMAYYAENSAWPPAGASADLVPDFITGTLRADYTWDNGLITGTLVSVANPWEGISWGTINWIRTPAGVE